MLFVFKSTGTFGSFYILFFVNRLYVFLLLHKRYHNIGNGFGAYLTF